MLTKVKKIISILALLVLFFILQASKPTVSNSFDIFDQKTTNLVKNKNQFYQMTKAKPQIILKSYDDTKQVNREKVDHKEILIAVIYGKKTNVKIIAGKDLMHTFTTTQNGNIIRYSVEDLRSTNNKKFNRGIRKTFNICATLIDQHYNFTSDANTITQKELDKVEHPQRLNLGWSLLIVIVAAAGFAWFQNWKIKL